MIRIPDNFLTISYNSDIIPGSVYPANLSSGANCQEFVYSILRHFHWRVPDYRSSELWTDREYTIFVDEFQPLDILFYHNKKSAYGAHLALFLGDKQVIHLSKAIGRPEIIDFTQLTKRTSYQVLLGGKRLKQLSTPSDLSVVAQTNH